MSPASTRRWLLVAALVTLPVPFYLGQVEWAPVLRLGFLSSLFGAVMLAEGGRATQLALLGFAQTAIYTGAFLAVASFAARAIARIGSPLRRATTVVGVVILLLTPALLLPIYETPLSSTRLRSTLWQIFE